MEQTNWYAIYTAFRAEKRVKERLDQVGMVNYLPLRVVEREINNELKRVEVPLFSGCVFVRTTRSELVKIQSITSVLSFLREGEAALAYSDELVASLRFLNDNADEIEVVDDDFLETSPLRIMQGALSGLGDEVIGGEDSRHVVVRIPGIGKVMAVIQNNIA